MAKYLAQIFIKQRTYGCVPSITAMLLTFSSNFLSTDIDSTSAAVHSLYSPSERAMVPYSTRSWSQHTDTLRSTSVFTSGSHFVPLTQASHLLQSVLLCPCPRDLWCCECSVINSSLDLSLAATFCSTSVFNTGHIETRHTSFIPVNKGFASNLASVSNYTTASVS